MQSLKAKVSKMMMNKCNRSRFMITSWDSIKERMVLTKLNFRTILIFPPFDLFLSPWNDKNRPYHFCRRTEKMIYLQNNM